jgi:NAD(P)-dependent dehydrogenase (short-subunit alcohol dehydrogenase family)
MRTRGSGHREAAAPIPGTESIRHRDVADDMQVGQRTRHVLSTLGPPRLLIDNAGVMKATAPLWEVPAAEFAPGLTLQCYCGCS